MSTTEGITDLFKVHTITNFINDKNVILIDDN
jgi:hypothetical protein